MIVLLNVEIGNSGDDSTRNEILAYDDSDTCVKGNEYHLADQFVELPKWDSGEPAEHICKVRIITPMNISTDFESSELVSKSLLLKK